ncbi:hypothetical protein CRYUN_Cryun28dG0034400 [Craigia yunnanensis]
MHTNSYSATCHDGIISVKVGGPLNPLSLPEMRSKEEMAVEMKVHPVKVNREAGGGADARFKVKNGSVFPKKKKLVKKMMLDSMVKFFSSFFFV